ncbi:lyase [Ferrimonas balearica]|uniref:Vgb family protein n=1 Tax=Ferrimonas balearica TaxID=44012 RepID=UPI001C967CDF|nr:lyase [Ferrimonas balearica]MBY6105731.1 lyase [Ferrimonas balearica]
MNARTLLRLCAAALLMLAPASQAAALPNLLTITEWPVQWQGRPRDPYVAPDGDVWFCGQSGNYLARFTPDTGQFHKVEIDEGTHPHNLIISADGTVWYAGNKNALIGAISPDSGKITRYAMPEGVSDPHTLVQHPDGHIWFTAQWSNTIGRLNPQTGAVKLASIPSTDARPYGIKVAPDGTVVAVLLGTNKLALVSADTLELTEITLPSEQARPRRLEISADGDIWYVDYVGGVLGQYNRDAQRFTDHPLPGGPRSQPYGTALDDNGILWIAQTGMQPNQIVGFDTQSKRYISQSEVPSGGTVRHMMFDAKSGAFWFGVDTGYLARGVPIGQ